MQPAVILLAVLIGIGTAAVIREDTCNATGISKPIEDLEQLVGNTRLLYVYDNYFDLPLPLCINNEISVPNRIEIALYEAVCGKKGDIKLKIASNPLTPGYISQTGNETLMRSGCAAIEVELRSVDDEYLLWQFPGLNVNELTASSPVSKAELQCVADKVDIMQGTEGSPVCWKN